MYDLKLTQTYCYKNGNGVLKMKKKVPKTKIIGLFTWLMNQQKYSNSISIKKGRLRSKKPTTKCCIKKQIKAYNNNTASNLFTLIEISQRHSNQVHSSDCVLCDIKGKTQ